MKIVLIFLSVLGSYLTLNSQNIIINYNSVSAQYEDYVKLNNKDVKAIYYSYINCNNNKNDSLKISIEELNELTFKMVPSVTPQVIQNSGDTIFITFTIDYRILPKTVYVFRDQEIVAAMFRHRLGYKIDQITKGSNHANGFKCIKNDDKAIIFFLCSFREYIIVEKEGFTFDYNCANKDILMLDNAKKRWYKELLETLFHSPCEPNNDMIMLPCSPISDEDPSVKYN